MLARRVRAGKARTSPLWRIFKRINPGLAKCCICKSTLSFKSSNTNLKRHLVARHYEVFEKLMGQRAPQSEPTSEQVSETEHVRKLIENVEKHPCLWDTRCISYGNEQLQHEAWSHIASRLNPQEEPREVVTRLSEQFNTQKIRYLSNRPCCYSNELSFMAPFRYGDLEELSLDKDAYDVPIRRDLIDESTVNREGPRSVNEQFKEGFVGNRERQSNKTECNVQLHNADEDTLFLLSLADEIRKVPEEVQMNFKADLLVKFNKQVIRYRDKWK